MRITPSELVDAPVIDEYPLILECKVIDMGEMPREGKEAISSSEEMPHEVEEAISSGGEMPREVEGAISSSGEIHSFCYFAFNAP